MFTYSTMVVPNSEGFVESTVGSYILTAMCNFERNVAHWHLEFHATSPSVIVLPLDPDVVIGPP